LLVTSKKSLNKRLDQNISGERLFSLRYQFADQWYALNNADGIKEPQSAWSQVFQPGGRISLRISSS
jgi:hypothetical protein